MSFAPSPVAELVGELGNSDLESLLAKLGVAARDARALGCSRPRIRRLLGPLLFNAVEAPQRCEATKDFPELREKLVITGLIPLAEEFRRELVISMGHHAACTMRATRPNALEVSNGITTLTGRTISVVEQAKVAPIARPHRAVSLMSDEARLLAGEVAPEFMRRVHRLRIEVAPALVLLGIPLGEIGGALAANPKYGYEFRAWRELRPEPFPYGEELAAKIVPAFTRLFNFWQQFERTTRGVHRALGEASTRLADPDIPLDML